MSNKQNKIEKILLVNPAIEMQKDSLRRLTNPLGLVYIGTVLKKNGFDVKLINSPCEGYENVVSTDGEYVIYGLSDKQMKEKIAKFNPDLVGIGNLFSAQRDLSFHHCDLVKEVTDAPVVMGGIHPTLAPEDCINQDSIDYVVMGEGEHRILNLIEGLNEGKIEFKFDGVAFKKDGKNKILPNVTRITNLDEYGVPDRSLIDMDKYLKEGVFYAPFTRKRRAERVMTSRGCPGKCVFCAYTTGKKMAWRSIENIIEEIDDLVDTYGIEEIHFSDDNLTINKKWAMRLFERLEPYNLAWCTPNGIMVNSLDKELIESAARSGAYQLTFNIESGSQRILKDIIHKIVPAKEKVRELVQICHDNNIQTHGQLMIGLPGETEKEIYQTLNYPYEVDFDSVSIFLANPLPGSQLFDICNEKGYIKKNRKIDLKSPEIIIPKDDPNYVMSGREMEYLVNKAVTDYNEFIKNRDPEKWDERYKVFDSIHGKDGLDVTGRVT